MADKPLILLHGEIKSPPFSASARIQAGFLLRQLQKGILLSMPESRPMSTIGLRCHGLRIDDADTNVTWRVIYRLDADAVLVAEIFSKKTHQTPQRVISACKNRFKHYDDL